MKLGIIGGVGPLAGYEFGKRLTIKSPALIDQDHIETILLSDTKIADRTNFILGKTNQSPLPKIKEDIKILDSLNVDNIAIICNTAHYFYDELIKETNVNIYNMVNLTLEKLQHKKIGLMSTQGTRDAKVYDKYATNNNVELIKLDEQHQEIVSEIIYSQVKKNNVINYEDFNKVTSYLFSLGCDKIILGCTELSLAKDMFNLDEKYVDPIDELINQIISDYY